MTSGSLKKFLKKTRKSNYKTLNEKVSVNMQVNVNLQLIYLRAKHLPGVIQKIQRQAGVLAHLTGKIKNLGSLSFNFLILGAFAKIKGFIWQILRACLKKFHMKGGVWLPLPPLPQNWLCHSKFKKVMTAVKYQVISKRSHRVSCFHSLLVFVFKLFHNRCGKDGYGKFCQLWGKFSFQFWDFFI